MRCSVCKKTSEEVKLFKGITNDGMVMICELCAEDENIPIIKKPSESQLDKADKRYSVRERMERMSGMRDRTEISEDQIVTQGNLAKLRMPKPKQHHEDVLDNYYWEINLARRRRKLSVNQLAEKMQVSSSVIQGIERGVLPEDFGTIFAKLEIFLGIKLLKNHKNKISFTRNINEEQEILKEVKEKMKKTTDHKDTMSESKKESIEEYEEDGRAFRDKLSEGKIDFSKRKDLSNVTLNDLVDIKREREKRAAIKKVKAEEEAMLGDDLDLDLELL